MITIKKIDNGMNPYNVDGLQLKRIVLFNENGIIFVNKQGWFGNCSCADIVELNIDGVDEVKRRRKENFKNVEVFMMTEKEDYGNENEGVLYIHEDLLTLERCDPETETYDTHYSVYNVYVLHGSFKTHLEEVNQIKVKIYKKSSETKFGKQVKEMEKELEDNGIHVGSFNLSNLMKKYHLTKKIV